MKHVNMLKAKLLELRRTLHLPAAKNGDSGGYVILDLLQTFPMEGNVEVTRKYQTGKLSPELL